MSFILRQYFSQDSIHAHLPRDSFRCTAVIAGDHHYFNAHLMQGRDGFFGVFLDRVGYRDNTGCLVIDCAEHGGLAIIGQHIGLRFQIAQIDIQALHHL